MLAIAHSYSNRFISYELEVSGSDIIFVTTKPCDKDNRDLIAYFVEVDWVCLNAQLYKLLLHGKN